MYQTNEKITQAHQDSMASIHAFGKKAVESTHNLAQTQFDASKEFIAKTQEKMMEFGKQKDPKDLMPVFTTQGFQEASTDLMAYQATLTAALRKNHHEIMEKADDAFDDAKKHLQELPIFTLESSDCEKIIELVDQILNGNDDVYNANLKIINNIIYKFIGLTSDEIKAVEVVYSKRA